MGRDLGEGSGSFFFSRPRNRAFFKSVVKHYWPDITLPDIALTEFSISHSPMMPAGFDDHLGLNIALRPALATDFPAAGQLLLQQRDID